jgi:hypothetical protein
MGTADAIAVLIQDWRLIKDELTIADQAKVTDLVRALAVEPIPDSAIAEAEDVVRIVSRALPSGHRLREALTGAGAGTLRLTGGRDPVDLARWFTAREELRRQVLPELDAVSTLDVHSGASEWLLGHESLTEDEVRAAGHDPRDDDLIRLPVSPGRSQWPAFQFRHEHQELVRAINRLLDAAADPWGAADWWLGRHARLGASPAELIGTVADDVLAAAAAAERSEAE